MGVASSAGNAAALCSRYMPPPAVALVTELGGTATAAEPSAAQLPIFSSAYAALCGHASSRLRSRRRCLP